MARKERIKRPVAERTDPDRRWKGAFGRSRPDREPGAPDPGAVPDERPRANDVRAASYEAVNGAYRVIDEYLRQGQRLAEEFWLPTNGASGGVPDVGRLLERFLRTAGDLGTTWLEMMTQWASTAERNGAGLGAAGPFTAGRKAADPVRTAGTDGHAWRERPAAAGGLSVRVDSTRKFEIAVDLFGGSAEDQLELTELATADRSAAPIRDIRLEAPPAADRVSIRITVPDRQPAGIYNGILLDRTSGRPRGTVSMALE